MSLLSTVSKLTIYLTTKLVHKTYFPYLIAPSLHAARTSVAFNNNVKLLNSQISWIAHFSGFLIMAWGGTLATHALLNLPPPHLYSVHPWINYLALHTAISALFHFFPSALSPRTTDTLLILPDAILRTASITAALDLVQTHPDPRLSSSIFLRILIGAVASAGGGTAAATLNVWATEWRLSTPTFMRRGAGLIGTLDVWSGSLAAGVYGLVLASHPVYLRLLISWGVPSPVVGVQGAKAVAAVLLAVLYAWRVVVLHWMPAPGRKEKTKTQ